MESSATADERLIELLVRWEELRRRGRDATAEELCPDCPDLAGELGRRIAQMRALQPPFVGSSTEHGPDESTSPLDGCRADGASEAGPDGRPARYRRLRFHARGGLGEVFVAIDEELHREVALKEIQPRHAHDPLSRARFLVEAEVTGGLEHPGIVPVHGLGAYRDGRPYYAMRFIRGDSLRDAIAIFHADAAPGRDPGRRSLELRKLLRRFLDVCNAIEYAHSRGVLHRDLKPHNVMVGKYGETLVVDWGLAKTLGRPGGSGVAPPEPPLRPTPASGSAETLPGSLVGTPAYMSPEQAAGRPDLLGPASDVYGLGATLYHLLAGRPPIDGKDLGELLRKVRSGDFPRPRAAAPWLDPALEAICLKAMALEPDARYAAPRALADDVERWVADEPVAAYPEPWTRRARRWAGRHRTALVTSAAAGAVAAILVGGFAWEQAARRQRTDASALAVLDQAERLAAEARSDGDLSRWIRAVAEARRARDQLEAGGGSASLRREAEARLESLQAEERRLRDDLRTVAALDEARLRATNIKDGHFDEEAKWDAYLDSFRAYGIDVAAGRVEDAAKQIRSSGIADDLISSLDDWASSNPTNVSAPRLQAIAREAETDPGRAAIRDAVARRDAAGLRRLCEREGDRRKLGPGLRSVFESLLRLDPVGSFPLLEAIRRENPSDFWLNHDLGMAYRKANPPRAEEAVRGLSVAVALRPDSPGAHLNLGLALREQGKLDQAIAEYRDAIRISPDDAEAHNNLGNALLQRGEPDRAIAEYGDAIRIRPHHPLAHYNLGNALRDRGKLDEAVTAYRDAIRISPDDAEAHYNLGNVLGRQGKLDQAIAEYRDAIRIKPGDAEAHCNVGDALRRLGRLDQAMAAYRDTVRINPDHATAHYNLGVALGRQGKLDPAIAEYRDVIRIRPDHAEAHCNLGLALQGKSLFREALESLERGHELGSGQPGWRYPSEDWVREARRLVELEGKIPAILKGEATPRDADELLTLADLCSKKALHAASARFFGEAFAERPALADDMAKGHRYNAACAAALAGSGAGKDDPPPDDAARAGLRDRARGWLRADLAAWTRTLAVSDEPARKKAMLRTLAHWKADADLAGLRDEGALTVLPEREREASRSLWADVEALRVKAEEIVPR